MEKLSRLDIFKQFVAGTATALGVELAQNQIISAAINLQV
jgi:hypothetical protein